MCSVPHLDAFSSQCTCFYSWMIRMPLAGFELPTFAMGDWCTNHFATQAPIYAPCRSYIHLANTLYAPCRFVICILQICYMHSALCLYPPYTLFTCTLYCVYMCHAPCLHAPCTLFICTLHYVYVDPALCLCGPCIMFMWALHYVYMRTATVTNVHVIHLVTCVTSSTILVKIFIWESAMKTLKNCLVLS